MKRAPGGEPRESRGPERLAALLVALSTVAYGVALAALLWARWVTFDPFLHDFARGTRVYERLLQGIPYPYSMHYYLFFYMGVYTLFLPVYALFRSVLVIFAIHLLSFTLAIPLLYRIARQVLPGVLLPLAVVVGYVLNPTLNLTAASFLRLEAPWMLLFLLTVFLETRRAYRPAFLAAMAACVIRLDAAPAIFMLGFLYFLQKKTRLGRKIMKGSLLIMALTVALMLVFRLASGIPPDAAQLHLTEILPGDGGSARTALTRTLDILRDPGSYRYAVVILQFLLLPLLAPLYLLPLLPSAAYIVLSSESFLSIPLVSSLLRPGGALVPYLHVHDTYVFPILFVAMIHGLRRLVAWGKVLTGARPGFARLFRSALAACLVVAFFLVHWFFATPALGPIPLTPGFSLATYRPGSHARLARVTLSEIPPDQPGLMQLSLAERAPAHGRLTEVYPWSEVGADTQYALFDLRAFSPNMPGEELLRIVAEILGRKDFRVERFSDGILLLRRGPAGPQNEALITWIGTHRHCLLEELNRPAARRSEPSASRPGGRCGDSVFDEAPVH